jgi:hypothetical protein
MVQKNHNDWQWQIKVGLTKKHHCIRLEFPMCIVLTLVLFGRVHGGDVQNGNFRYSVHNDFGELIPFWYNKSTRNMINEAEIASQNILGELLIQLKRAAVTLCSWCLLAWFNYYFGSKISVLTFICLRNFASLAASLLRFLRVKKY